MSSTATPPKTPLKKSTNSKTWLVIGNMRYGTKRTDDVLNKRAEFIFAHPELYSIHAKAKRLRYEYYDVKFAINSGEVVRALGISLRQAQRMLKLTRTKLRKAKGDYVGISEFCRLHGYNEILIRKAIVPAPKR